MSNRYFDIVAATLGGILIEAGLVTIPDCYGFLELACGSVIVFVLLQFNWGKG